MQAVQEVHTILLQNMNFGLMAQEVSMTVII